jgi:hypothetical protein
MKASNTANSLRGVDRDEAVGLTTPYVISFPVNAPPPELQEASVLNTQDKENEQV